MREGIGAAAAPRRAAVLLVVLAGLPAAALSRLEALNELNLPTNFDDGELKAAYRKRSLETHPDKGGSTAEFLRVSEAYELLRDGGGSFDGFSGSGGFSGGGGGAGGGGDGGARQGHPAFTEEEAMRYAEAMLSNVLEEFLKFDVDGWIDQAFGDAKNPLSWLAKKGMKAAGRAMAKGLTEAVESGSWGDVPITMTVGGQSYTAEDLKAFWRQLKARSSGARSRRSEL